MLDVDAIILVVAAVGFDAFVVVVPNPDDVVDFIVDNMFLVIHCVRLE